MIGEDPQGTPNNLMPYVSQVAVGRRDKVTQTRTLTHLCALGSYVLFCLVVCVRG